MKKLLFFPAVLVLILALASCDDDGPKEILCTDQYVILTVEAEDGDGNPVTFDSVAVSRDSDDFLYEFDILHGFQEGTYILMTDKFFNDLSTNGTEITFEGFEDDGGMNLIASEEYTVRQGECHVEKVSGEDVIVVTP